MSKFKLAGGYTYDPDFLPLDDDDEEDTASDDDTEISDDDDASDEPESDEDVPDPSTKPTATSGAREAVTVEDFDLSDFRKHVAKRGVTLTSGKGLREPPKKGASTDHPGIDLAVPVGTAVYSPLDGVVSAVGNVAKGGDRGNFIEIAHGDKFITRYYHLRDMPTLTKNSNVLAGNKIGLVGSTGNSTGYHLHFEVYEVEVDANSAKSSLSRIDPIEWLKDNPDATFPVAVTDE